MKRKQMPSIEFGIIGLGTFGISLAKRLASAGKEVIVLDKDESKVSEIKDIVSSAYIVKSLDLSVLEETGIQNCETVIVCISKDIAASALITLNVISMNIPRVFAKATSDEHGKILEKLGAEVIYPERDIAYKVGGMLLNSRKLDFINLNGNISISEFKIPDNYIGKSVKSTNIRNKYSLNIIAIESDGKTNTNIEPEIILNASDYIVVVGDNHNIERFEKDNFSN